MKRSVSDSIRLALGGMTDDAHKELEEKGYKPTDETKKHYVSPDGMEMPANKMHKVMSSEGNKKGKYPTPN